MVKKKPRGKNGGAREGAGRPISNATIKAQMFRELLQQRIEGRIDLFLDAWEDLALGHWLEITTETGTKKVYKTAPDQRAMKAIMDQAMGRAPQGIDLTSGGDKIDGFNIKITNAKET